MAGVERVGIEGVDRVVMCGSVGSDQVMQERRQHARQHARQHICIYFGGTKRKAL